jgi:hypothetical protein
MSPQDSAYEALRGKTDFAAVIAWRGIEDKPFYRAKLVSASRAATAQAQPFWGTAVIDAAEFARLAAVLRDAGVLLSPGPDAAGGVNEYYVEIQADGEQYSGSLGFDRNTSTTLDRLAGALEPAHRTPIQDIIARIQAALPKDQR